MIKNIQFKFGKTGGDEKLLVDIAPLTIFVGPNNSGKSKVLREIYNFCINGEFDSKDVIVENINFIQLETDEAKSMLDLIVQGPQTNQSLRSSEILVGNYSDKKRIKKDIIEKAYNKETFNISIFCKYIFQFYSILLDGKSRINLINQKAAGDLQKQPINSLSTLFKDDSKRKEVRRIIYDAFNSYFVIDPTDLGQLKIKLSPTSPINDLVERGIHSEAVEFHSKADNISELSDGVKAFTGIICELIAGDPRLILIDEPEAFLHPSLSFKLGKEISNVIQKSSKELFASTHSSHFIMGCIQSGAPVNIIRLTYREKVATVRVLPSDKLLKLMRNPLLRSTGVIEGLFYESVVVTEADSDRAFYQEINQRLLKYKPEYGIPNCLFINAQNKQTIHQIIKPLRELGIPAAAIVDVDILKEGGKVWTDFLNSGFVPGISQRPLGDIRREVKRKFDDSGINMKTDGGISCLNPSDKEAAENLFEQLNNYGLFAVQNGELEVWLKELGVCGHGSKWLVDIFEKMGENPDANNFLKPKEDDVWQFINSIRKWLLNPIRKGIPNE